MGSVAEVASENAAVYQALPSDGIAVINADDAHAEFFRSRAGAREVVDFGLNAKAAVTARHALKPLTSELAIRTPGGTADAMLAIPGLHNVRNALAAAAAAHAAGINVSTIARGLMAFRPYTGRLQVKEACNGATLIDDTYNANPDSVRAAIDVLASCPGPRVLVLGDMGEVGEHGRDFHREVGAYARSKGIELLLGLGDATRDAVQAFGDGGRHFEKLEALIANVSGKSILVKGSRFMKMERVVAALTGAPAKAGH
jgi:UDP-N-acetylmuramyl pentapeptide synthase